MTVHIEEMESEVVALGGDVPLTPAQVQHLVTIVLQQLEKRQQDRGHNREATALRASAAPGEPDGR